MIGLMKMMQLVLVFGIIRKHEEVLEYLNNLPDANGRSSVMDAWGIFKYE